MALAPYPTTEIDGITFYAAPSRNGPRHRFIVFDVRGDHAHEWAAADTLEKAKSKAAVYCDRIVDATEHEWTPTPQHKVRF